ncbi:insulin-like growth factor-binding protein complex acid labile subunit [Bradysia coprophila]|uniref:insulin-like growth factor-binding protein complex acid labile subunit n=1 Tax=Bradysia coprophila TaxID=38358 RepID=UPI00187DB913|nr:insulin-like growth factor-binding protein complex acid labile subunit [Bradysia coprophila]
MFCTKLIWIFTAILATSQTVSAKKCVYVRIDNDFNSREIDLVECKNVSSMNELSSDIRFDWRRLKVINKIGDTFTIAENDQGLEYIQRLDLSQAGSLDVAEYGFRGFSQLIELNISSTHTSILRNSWFSRRNNIQILDFSWNQLTSLKQDSLRTLSQLSVANFSHNEIEDIEMVAFSSLQSMKILDLRNNRIAHLFDLGDLSTLEILNLDENFLVELPPNGFHKLKGLRTLTLSENTISTLQRNCFYGLEALRTLNISGNSITNIQNYIFDGFSTVLKELDISKNYISQIDSNAFQNLNFLQILNLSGNSIKDLMENTFYGLNALRKLYLLNNDISSIEPRTFDELQNLEELDLSGNALQSFSGIVFGHSMSPRKLRKLFLKNNKLLEIHPHTFNHIPNIDYLSLSFNSIVRLDDNLLLPLTALKKLHIDHNNIEELSASLFNTTLLLQELYIAHNKLTFFPEVDNEFRNLVKASLEGNPWQCPCLNDIIDWMKQKGVDYKRTRDNPYYAGLKPICVLNSRNDCIKDIDVARELRIVEIYTNSLK